MQQCGDCLKIYDESEDAFCPFCADADSNSYDEELRSVGLGGVSMITCSECDGEGFDVNDEDKVCPMCYGTGWMEE